MLKRVLFIIIVFSFAFLSVGAASSTSTYNYQFIKTSYRDDIEIKAIISSKEELKFFYEKYKNTLYLEHREKVYADSTIGFIDAIEKYDEEYFKESNLIIIYFTEASGSITHSIKDISVNDGTLDIDIIQKCPGYFTWDMAGWLLILEVDNPIEITSINYTKAKEQ